MSICLVINLQCSCTKDCTGTAEKSQRLLVPAVPPQEVLLCQSLRPQIDNKLSVIVCLKFVVIIVITFY